MSVATENDEQRRPANLRRVATGSMELSLLENDPDDDVVDIDNDEVPILSKPAVRSSGDFVSTFAAGVGSGFLSSIICAPLDLMRTRMQVWGEVGAEVGQATPTQAIQEILHKEGWRGMFRGLGATLVTVPLFWGVYFPLYDETKHKVRVAYPDIHPAVVHCSSAVFTGAIADIICNPLFVIRTRVQTQALHQLAEHQQLKQSSMLQTAQELYTVHGPTVFWRGMSANLMGLSHVAVQFPTYEFLKKQARERRDDGQPETALELLLASGLAKICASLLTYPHEVLRSRMMDSRAAVAPTLKGTISHIWKEEGFGGYYRGLPVTLIRVIPNCCITFISYEFLARWTKEQWTEWHQNQEKIK